MKTCNEFDVLISVKQESITLRRSSSHTTDDFTSADLDSTSADLEEISVESSVEMSEGLVDIDIIDILRCR